MAKSVTETMVETAKVSESVRETETETITVTEMAKRHVSVTEADIFLSFSDLFSETVTALYYKEIQCRPLFMLST